MRNPWDSWPRYQKSQTTSGIFSCQFPNPRLGKVIANSNFLVKKPSGNSSTITKNLSPWIFLYIIFIKSFSLNPILAVATVKIFIWLVDTSPSQEIIGATRDTNIDIYETYGDITRFRKTGCFVPLLGQRKSLWVSVKVTTLVRRNFLAHRPLRIRRCYHWSKTLFNIWIYFKR